MDIDQQNKANDMPPNRRKVIIRHIGYALIVLSALLIYDLSGIGCPVRYLFGVDCPSCGMTRSIFAMLRLDFKAAFIYNPMTMPVVVAFLLGIHKVFIKRKILVDIFIIIVAVVTFSIYLFKLFGTYL